MKKKGVITVVAMAMMMVSMIMLTRAQLECWDRIIDCLDVGTLSICCPTLREEVENERDCFCAMKPALDRNASTKNIVNDWLSTCDLSSSFDRLCTFATTSTSPPMNTHVPDSNSHPMSPPMTPPLSPPLQHSGQTPSKGNNLLVIVPAIVVPLVSVIVTLVIVGFCIFKKKGKKHQTFVGNADNNAGNNNNMQTSDLAPSHSIPFVPLPVSISGDNSSDAPGFKNNDFASLQSLQYGKGTLLAATNNFSSQNEIGRGGFGVVYKGVLADGQEIAVKRLSAVFKQGDEEFKNEVSLLAKLQHRNLVKLMGFSLANNEKILVYEYVPNKSLDYFLFDSRKKEVLNWSMRYNIIKGVARGMLYVHEDSPTRIIHRDLKAANVLLDADMDPKIADFGLARVCAFDQTHVATCRIAGTNGYMAPEYLVHGTFSTKSDVYSYGVLILEIICGRKVSDICRTPAGTLNLLSYAWTCWLDGKPLGLVDPTMGGSYSNDEIIKCVHLGLLCVQEDITKRPTMVTIVHTLNTSSAAATEALTTPKPPSILSTCGSDQMTTTTNTSSVPSSLNIGSVPSSQNTGSVPIPSPHNFGSMPSSLACDSEFDCI